MRNLVAVLVVLCVLANAQAGLVGLWALNEGSGTVVHDSSGNGNDGTLYGDAAWVTTPGQSGISVSGAGYINFGHSASLNLGSTFTIEAWVKIEGISGEAMILGKDTTLYGLSFYGNGRSYYYGGGSGGNNLATAPPAHQYIHIVGTTDYSAAGTNMFLYVNGVQVASRASLYPMPDSANNDLFAGTSRTLTDWFTGTFDELRLYNTALSSADVAADYAAGPTVPEPASCTLLACGLIGLLRKRK